MSATISQGSPYADVFDFSMWRLMDGRSPCFHFVEGFAFRLGHLQVLTSGGRRASARRPPPLGRLVPGGPLGSFSLFFSFLFS